MMEKKAAGKKKVSDFGDTKYYNSNNIVILHSL